MSDALRIQNEALLAEVARLKTSCAALEKEREEERKLVNDACDAIFGYVPEAYAEDGHPLTVAEKIDILGGQLIGEHTQLGTLREALQKLVTRLEFVHSSSAYKSVWTISQIHVGPYQGPSYADELKAAKDVLTAKGENDGQSK